MVRHFKVIKQICIVYRMLRKKVNAIQILEASSHNNDNATNNNDHGHYC